MEGETIILRKDHGNKKFIAVLPGHPRPKHIKFGQKGAEDYTTHNSDLQKIKYIKRHKTNEDWKDIRTAGFWARWILWNRPTIEESIKDVEKAYGVKIIYRSAN